MIFYYLDASAWVKRYFEERGSTWIRELFSRSPSLACSSLGVVEVAATLARKGRGLGLPAETLREKEGELERDWQVFIRVNLTEAVLSDARSAASKFALRGADAVHFASAQMLARRLSENDVLVMITSDLELADAVVRAGIRSIDPADSG